MCSHGPRGIEDIQRQVFALFPTEDDTQSHRSIENEGRRLAMIVDRQTQGHRHGAEVEIPESQKSWQRLLRSSFDLGHRIFSYHLTLHNAALETDLTITRLRYNISVRWKITAIALQAIQATRSLLGGDGRRVFQHMQVNGCILRR
jgi:hypothetical protein